MAHTFPLTTQTVTTSLSPVPFRGKRNNSGNIIYTAEKIAEIKNTTAEEVLRITKENAENVYNIDLYLNP